MTIKNLSEELSGCAYPGRGIVAGMSEDGKKAVSAYFIMGRSESSRNRVFVQDGEGIRTEAFDPSTLLVAPELIIYAPVRVLGNNTIVTNGDQTDTVYDGLSEGKTFEESLRGRKDCHDAPNYTRRISSVLHIENNEYSYAMSILKSHNGNPDICERHTYTYDAAFASQCTSKPLPSGSTMVAVRSTRSPAVALRSAVVSTTCAGCEQAAGSWAHHCARAAKSS